MPALSNINSARDEDFEKMQYNWLILKETHPPLNLDRKRKTKNWDCILYLQMVKIGLKNYENY